MDTMVDHFTPLALRVRGNKYKHEVGQVISTNHEPLEMEWLTRYYSGTQEREGDIMVCVIMLCSWKTCMK